MFTNNSSKEINFKLVYVGPQLSGTAENLHYIYEKTAPSSRGSMVTVHTGPESTLFFDLALESLGEIRGYHVRIHLYCLAGKAEYEASLKLLLKNSDGLIFVADCQKKRLEANIAALERVKFALRDQGRDWSQFPKAVQLNRYRRSNALPAAAMKRALELEDEPTIVADTQDGGGVLDTLQAGVKELLLGLKENRVKEWAPTPEEQAGGDEMLSRVQLVSHYHEFFGEAPQEYEPRSPSPKDAPFYIMAHLPTKDRPYYTYATFGVSTTPQPAGGPAPRIELLAYSPVENKHIVERLASVAIMIKTSSAKDPPFKTFDIVDLGDIGDSAKFDTQFALVPPAEAPAFFQFPDSKRKLQDLLFTRAVGAATDSEARVTFLKLLPLTTDEAKFAAEQTTRELIEKFAPHPKQFGWGRTPEESVLHDRVAGPKTRSTTAIRQNRWVRVLAGALGIKP